MEMLKSELRKAEESVASLTREHTDTGTVDRIRKMKDQNESLGAENFEYAVENVSFFCLKYVNSPTNLVKKNSLEAKKQCFE